MTKIKYVVLISEPIYGSMYLSQTRTGNWEATKDRTIAATFNSNEEAEWYSKECAIRWKCSCYVSTITETCEDYDGCEDMCMDEPKGNNIYGEAWLENEADIIKNGYYLYK